MTAIIPSAQLEAITRLEFAAIAAGRARGALAHPDLQLGGAAILAPSGQKHLVELRATLDDISSKVRSSDPSAYEPRPPLLDVLRQQVSLAVGALAAAQEVCDDAIENIEPLRTGRAHHRQLLSALLDLEHRAVQLRLAVDSLSIQPRVDTAEME